MKLTNRRSVELCNWEQWWFHGGICRGWRGNDPLFSCVLIRQHGYAKGKSLMPIWTSSQQMRVLKQSRKLLFQRILSDRELVKLNAYRLVILLVFADVVQLLMHILSGVYMLCQSSFERVSDQVRSILEPLQIIGHQAVFMTQCLQSRDSGNWCDHHKRLHLLHSYLSSSRLQPTGSSNIPTALRQAVLDARNDCTPIHFQALR